MKAAIVYDNGEIETYGDVEAVTKNTHNGSLSVTFDVKANDGVSYYRYHGQRPTENLIDFFGLEAVKKGKRIPKSAIRKGDLIRMVDHSTPLPGERDYKTIEYVATANGDDGYQFNAGERFYLLDRPKIELPTTPGSVVEVRLKDNGVQRVTLGNDELWRGRDVHADSALLAEYAEVLEVIA